jgi:hypothetical protein
VDWGELSPACERRSDAISKLTPGEVNGAAAGTPGARRQSHIPCDGSPEPPTAVLRAMSPGRWTAETASSRRSAVETPMDPPGATQLKGRVAAEGAAKAAPGTAGHMDVRPESSTAEQESARNRDDLP